MSFRHLAMVACVAALAMPAGRAATPQVTGDGAALPDEETRAPAVVTGFRSANFGMDESAVRRAIFSDFDLSGGAVVRTRNDLEQTTVLTVAGQELVPDAGPAIISYVLGQGGTLIQVTILWGLADPPVSAAALETTARILIDFFNDQGFASQIGPEPMVFVDGTNLLYYARGAEGGGLAISALPRRQWTGEGDAPPILRLAYAADLANPDVFRAPSITP